MSTALISLGSNVGDRAANLRRALELLALNADLRVAATSSLHKTKPAGGPVAQESFLNAAALLETNLPPRELFSILQRIENELGRVRSERWGPRTIDLDLLLYDQLELDAPELTIPHPRMSFRRFVLEPAAEIAADMIHPVCGNTIGGLLRHLSAAPRVVFFSPRARMNVPDIGARIPGIQLVEFPHLRKIRATVEQARRIVARSVETSNRDLAAAIAALDPNGWVFTNWWEAEWLWSTGSGLSTDFCESLTMRPMPKLVVLRQREGRLRSLIREHYRGPALFIEDDGDVECHSEVLAAVAAME